MCYCLLYAQQISWHIMSFLESSVSSGGGDKCHHWRLLMDAVGYGAGWFLFSLYCLCGAVDGRGRPGVHPSSLVPCNCQVRECVAVCTYVWMYIHIYVFFFIIVINMSKLTFSNHKVKTKLIIVFIVCKIIYRDVSQIGICTGDTICQSPHYLPLTHHHWLTANKSAATFVGSQYNQQSDFILFLFHLYAYV